MKDFFVKIKQVLAKIWEFFTMFLGGILIIFLITSCYSSTKQDEYSPYESTYEDNNSSYESTYVEDVSSYDSTYVEDDSYYDSTYAEDDSYYDSTYEEYERDKWSPSGDYIGY